MSALRVVLVTHYQAHSRIRSDRAEHFAGLLQDLLAVRNEQNPAELRTGRVERRQPRLPRPVAITTSPPPKPALRV